MAPNGGSASVATTELRRWPRERALAVTMLLEHPNPIAVIHVQSWRGGSPRRPLLLTFENVQKQCKNQSISGIHQNQSPHLKL